MVTSLNAGFIVLNMSFSCKRIDINPVQFHFLPRSNKIPGFFFQSISENPTKWDTSIINLEDVVCKPSMINSDLSKMTSAADICRLYRPVFIRYSELFYSNTVFRLPLLILK